MNPETLLQNLAKSQYTRTDYFHDKTHEYLKKVQEQQKLTGRFARQVVRKAIAGTVGYKKGELGLSEVGGMLSRKERRALAKEMKIEFVPVYNGLEPVYVKPVKEKKKKDTN